MERKEIYTEFGMVISYTWKTFECEICKNAYPYTFKNNSRKYKLTSNIDQDMPKNVNEPYILMESMVYEKNSMRIVHLIKPKEVEDSNAI